MMSGVWYVVIGEWEEGMWDVGHGRGVSEVSGEGTAKSQSGAVRRA